LKKFTEQFDETKLKEKVMNKKKGSESGNPADLFCVSRDDGDDVMCGSSSSAALEKTGISGATTVVT